MLIISNKKDYYDGVVSSMGIDKSIVYERKEEKIKQNNIKFPNEFKKSKDWNNPNLLTDHIYLRFKKKVKYDTLGYFIIGFCGKLYVGWKFCYRNIEKNYSINNDIIDIFYDKNNVLKYVESNTYLTRRNNINDFYNYVENFDATELFFKLNSPVFIYDSAYSLDSITAIRNYDKVFIINPNLNEYKFYRVFDSFRAFQEIQMFISGVLGTKEKETIEINDKDKIIQHGFDYKWSFRKEPTKKK